MPSKVASELLDFDVDRYMNPYVPRNRLDRLPAPISRILGYRKDTFREPPAVLQWFSAFIGAFVGILIIGAIFSFAPGVADKNPPVIIASLGASAILNYSCIRVPVAQPRNSVLGQALSAIVGVCISKLFQLNPDFESIQWIAGAMACACASLIMCVTNTVHPPGGATAVLAATQANIIDMGWWYVPVILLGSIIMLVVALLWNNILRQYPVYWWSSADVGSQLRSKKAAAEDDVDIEKKPKRKASDTSDNTLQHQLSNASTAAPASEEDVEELHEQIVESDLITISATDVHIPSYMRLSPQERAMLAQFRGRIRRHV